MVIGILFILLTAVHAMDISILDSDDSTMVSVNATGEYEIQIQDSRIAVDTSIAVHNSTVQIQDSRIAAEASIAVHNSTVQIKDSRIAVGASITAQNSTVVLKLDSVVGPCSFSVANAELYFELSSVTNCSNGQHIEVSGKPGDSRNPNTETGRVKLSNTDGNITLQGESSMNIACPLEVRGGRLLLDGGRLIMQRVPNFDCAMMIQLLGRVTIGTNASLQILDSAYINGELVVRDGCNVMVTQQLSVASGGRVEFTSDVTLVDRLVVRADQCIVMSSTGTERCSSVSSPSVNRFSASSAKVHALSKRALPIGQGIRTRKCQLKIETGPDEYCLMKNDTNVRERLTVEKQGDYIMINGSLWLYGNGDRATGYPTALNLTSATSIQLASNAQMYWVDKVTMVAGAQVNIHEGGTLMVMKPAYMLEGVVDVPAHTPMIIA